MIRPRCGDFVYTNLDLEVMRADIDQFKEMGIAGIVLGILSPDGTVDIPSTKR
jgi:copper homeostasis protein